MSIKFYINATTAITVCLVLCLIASCIIRTGYLVICSLIAIILSLLVLKYLKEVQDGEKRKAIRSLKRLQYIEQDKQLTREELFRSYTANDFEEEESDKI